MDPYFFGEEKFLTGAGRCVLSFSQNEKKRAFVVANYKTMAANVPLSCDILQGTLLAK